MHLGIHVFVCGLHRQGGKTDLWKEPEVIDWFSEGCCYFTPHLRPPNTHTHTHSHIKNTLQLKSIFVCIQGCLVITSPASTQMPLFLPFCAALPSSPCLTLAAPFLSLCVFGWRTCFLHVFDLIADVTNARTVTVHFLEPDGEPQ